MHNQLIISVAAILLSLQGFAQGGYDDIDKKINTSPTALAIEAFAFKKIPIPENLAQFAGVRFVDATPYKSIGFVKMPNRYKQIIVENGLVESVNKKLKSNGGSSNADSLLIFIKYFWQTRIPLDLLYANLKPRLEQQEKTVANYRSYCHIDADYYVKQGQQLVYAGQFDSLLPSFKSLLVHYDDFAHKAVRVLLERAPISTVATTRQETEPEVWKGLKKAAQLIDTTLLMADGYFLTFNDFKNGHIEKRAIELAPRIGFYKLISQMSNIEQAIAAKCWGLCYKGAFYIRLNHDFYRLFKAGATYATTVGYMMYDENLTPRYYQGVLGPNINIVYPITGSKYRYDGHEFIPLLLNPLTGYLE
jgi:hypothetical protein